MDRFDDMRAKNSKPKLQSKTAIPNASGQIVAPDTGYDGLSQVTVNGDSNLTSDNIKSGVSIFGVNGSYGGGGGSGSTGYNVFVQQSEPESKNGVWIKSNGGNGETKFYEYATATGKFLEASKFNFLKTTEETVAQQIIDGYMYVIARYSSSSYKINLETQAKTSINTLAFEDPNKYWLTPLGSFVYEGKIYIFGAYSGTKMYYYIYDVATDTSSPLISIELGHGVGGTNTYQKGLNCYEYNGKAVLMNYLGDYRRVDIIDLKSATLEKSISLTAYSNSYWYLGSAYGQYLYNICSYNSTRIYRFDILTQTDTVVANAPEEGILYATADKIYLFKYGSSGNDYYYIYDIAKKEWTKMTTQNKYFLYTRYYNYTDSSNNSIINSLMLDDKSGILYFRTSKGNAQPSAMQFAPSPELDELSTGTAVIVQSQYKNVTKIENSSNIHTGVENAYLKTSDDLVSQLTLLGNGENWSVLSNPNGETATVTFNANGGTSVDSVEVVIGQKLLTKPETTRSDNYIFDAWYLGSEPFDFSTEIIKDITLTAHWLEYEEVDYIESTGTQYIDTGIVPKSTTKVDCEMAVTDITSGKQINGWGSTGSVEAIFWGLRSTGYLTSCFSGSYVAVDCLAGDVEKHSYSMSNGSQTIDGVQYATDTMEDTAEDGQTIYLFAQHTEFSPYISYAKERIFSCQIYDNDTLVRNFQPIQIETGEYALVDKVNNKVYHNAGTGEFIAGEEV